MPSNSAPSRAPLLLPLLLLAAGCASPSTPPRTLVVPSLLILPLPASARPPVPPQQCLPTCSANAQIDALSWRDTLTRPALPASSASGAMTR